VRAFGEKVFDVIEAAPDRLREVEGIGPVRAASILAAWAEQKAVREIMVFLHSHGVGTARAVRIFKTYGADAIQVMTENPYRLARDIRGIGFKTADAIAMKLGIEKTAIVRVRAGISYALTEAMDEGHCGLPTEELIPLAEKLLEVPREHLHCSRSGAGRRYGRRRPRWRNALHISVRSAPRGADDRRAADAVGRWHAALALD
jgi:exodeoxyribonuclease V alpha subunit